MIQPTDAKSGGRRSGLSLYGMPAHECAWGKIGSGAPPILQALDLNAGLAAAGATQALAALRRSLAAEFPVWLPMSGLAMSSGPNYIISA